MHLGKLSLCVGAWCVSHRERGSIRGFVKHAAESIVKSTSRRRATNIPGAICDRPWLVLLISTGRVLWPGPSVGSYAPGCALGSASSPFLLGTAWLSCSLLTFVATIFTECWRGPVGNAVWSISKTYTLWARHGLLMRLQLHTKRNSQKNDSAKWDSSGVA